jgi:hypothetical protein
MSAIGDITVKQKDGTTNVTFSAVAGASGNEPARWQNETVLAGYPAAYPTLTYQSKWNGTKDARRHEGTFQWPLVRDKNYNTGSEPVYEKTGGVVIELRAVIPVGMSSDTVEEAVAEATNLFVSAAIRDSLVSGYAPT